MAGVERRVCGCVGRCFFHEGKQRGCAVRWIWNLETVPFQAVELKHGFIS